MSFTLTSSSKSLKENALSYSSGLVYIELSPAACEALLPDLQDAPADVSQSNLMVKFALCQYKGCSRLLRVH